MERCRFSSTNTVCLKVAGWCGGTFTVCAIYTVFYLKLSSRYFPPLLRCGCGRPVDRVKWNYKQTDRKWQTVFVSYNNGPVYEGSSTELPVISSDVSNSPGRPVNVNFPTRWDCLLPNSYHLWSINNLSRRFIAKIFSLTSGEVYGLSFVFDFLCNQVSSCSLVYGKIYQACSTADNHFVFSVVFLGSVLLKCVCKIAKNDY